MNISQPEELFKATVYTWMSLATLARRYQNNEISLEEYDSKVGHFVAIEATTYKAARMIAEVVAQKGDLL